MRKNQILEEFRRPPNNKSSRSKDVKNRLHHFRHKETFLTDTQASDYTKSSNEINITRIDHLEDNVRKLQRQNAELRQRVVDLKATQCFEINQEKLKNVIRETDRLRAQLEQTKKSLEQSFIQRAFLERYNKTLKSQCESLTKQLMVFNASSPNPHDSKRQQKNIYTSRDESLSIKSRNSSEQPGMIPKRGKQFLQWKRDKQERSSQKNLLKGSLSASQLHEDYYGGKSSRILHGKNH